LFSEKNERKEDTVMMKSLKMAGLTLGLLAVMVLSGPARTAQADGDLSKKADSIGKSLKDTAERTGDYLKSDSFHKTVGRVVDGAAKAFRNGEKWVGQKIEGISGSQSKHP
jgi:hypothetical protein